MTNNHTTKELRFSGTVQRFECRLDAASSSAMQWAAQWATNATGYRSSLSAVVRRALEVYADHLDKLPDHLRAQEGHRIKAASCPSRIYPAYTASLKAATERATKGESLPSWSELMRSTA